MDHAASGAISSCCVFDVSSVRSFVDAVSGLASCPPGTTLAAFRVRDGIADHVPDQRFVDALHALGNLAADSAMISLCHLEGRCTGALLGLALRCDVVTVTPSASMTIAWSDPAAAVVHAVAAERVGAVACERRLFDRTCDAVEAADRGLASFLCDGFETALTRCTARIRTTHATARAFRLAYPFSLEVATALAAPFADES